MAVTRTGTAVTIANTNQSFSQAITVPADAQIAVVVAAIWRYQTNWIAANPVSLGGSTLTTVRKTDTTSDNNQLWLGYLALPATGSQTLSVNWGAVPTGGANIAVVFYKGIDTSDPIRASAVQTTSWTNLTTGLTASAGDMMFGGVASDSAVTVTANGQTQVANNLGASIYLGTAQKDGGTSFQFTGGDYTTVAALVLRQGAGGTGASATSAVGTATAAGLPVTMTTTQPGAVTSAGTASATGYQASAAGIATALHIGVIGDSGLDEYRADNARGGSYAAVTFNPLEMLVRVLGTSVIDSGPWGTRAEPRRSGYEYNWARDGATAGDAYSGSGGISITSPDQIAGLSAQVSAGSVDSVVIWIGANDFALWNGTYAAVYNGTVSGANLTAKINSIITNITNALDSVLAAGAARVLVANLINISTYPYIQVDYPNAAYRQRVTDSIDTINAAVDDLVASYPAVGLIDRSTEMTQLLAAYPPDGSSNITVAGEVIAPTAGDEPHNALLADGQHYGTIYSSILANILVIDGFNTLDADLPRMMDAQIVAQIASGSASATTTTGAAAASGTAANAGAGAAGVSSAGTASASGIAVTAAAGAGAAAVTGGMTAAGENAAGAAAASAGTTTGAANADGLSVTAAASAADSASTSTGLMSAGGEMAAASAGTAASTATGTAEAIGLTSGASAGQIAATAPGAAPCDGLPASGTVGATAATATGSMTAAGYPLGIFAGQAASGVTSRGMGVLDGSACLGSTGGWVATNNSDSALSGEPGTAAFGNADTVLTVTGLTVAAGMPVSASTGAAASIATGSQAAESLMAAASAGSGAASQRGLLTGSGYSCTAAAGVVALVAAAIALMIGQPVTGNTSLSGIRITIGVYPAWSLAAGDYAATDLDVAWR